jgi:hypothetical protein
VRPFTVIRSEIANLCQQPDDPGNIAKLAELREELRQLREQQWVDAVVARAPALPESARTTISRAFSSEATRRAS